jgi:hypothetical protein
MIFFTLVRLFIIISVVISMIDIVAVIMVIASTMPPFPRVLELILEGARLVRINTVVGTVTWTM